MINRILERLREERIKEQECRGKSLNENSLREANDAHERIRTLNKIEAIVQEVAKEYKCANCKHEEEPPYSKSCSFCMHQFTEDNFEPKEAPYQKGE